MKEEQLEQLKIIETNQLYQFLANLDLGLLNIYSKNINRFYNCIEEETIEDKEKVWKELTEYLYCDINDSLKLHIGMNDINMEYYYYKYSKGDFDEKVEEESFKADFVKSTIPVIFNKSDFEDIDKLYNSTEKYRRFEYETLGSEVDVYNNTWIFSQSYLYKLVNMSTLLFWRNAYEYF